MKDPFANYDQWLEEPYQRLVEDSDRYNDWCESEGLDPDVPETSEAYAEYCMVEYGYEDYDDIDDIDYQEEWELE